MRNRTIGAVLGGIGLVLVPAAAFGIDAMSASEAGQGDADRLTLADQTRDRDQDCDGTCDGDGDGYRGRGGMMSRPGDGTAALDLVDGDLSDEDAEALAFMVEEEKLAHDLYVAFGDEWDLRVFDMIASAEAHHQEAVASLLDAYGLDDPTEGNDVGEFDDDGLQDLYDTLLAQGLGSEVEALTVGALVEETDIADLRERATDEESIDLLFSRLETASANHLDAFVVNLDRLDVAYEPEVLTDDDLADLADGTRGGGRMGGHHRAGDCLQDS